MFYQTTRLSTGQYTFSADIYDPINKRVISNRYPLQFLATNYHIVIQTDKELYKSEDLIRFRLFAFDSESRPADVPGSASVSIIDPLGFTFRNIQNVTFTKGRFKDEMELSSIIIEGLWVIRVEAGEKVS